MSFSNVAFIHPLIFPSCFLHLYYLFICFILFLFLSHLFCVFNLFFLPFLCFSSCLYYVLFPRPVRYQKRPRLAWLLLKTRPGPGQAQCHAGTSSKPGSRERWRTLYQSDTCSSACFPGLMPILEPQPGVSRLPFDLTSPGRVCLFLGNRPLALALAAGG